MARRYGRERRERRERVGSDYLKRAAEKLIWFDGVYLDINDSPRGLLSEEDAKALCEDNGIRYRSELTSAHLLSRELAGKLSMNDSGRGEAPCRRRMGSGASGRRSMESGESEFIMTIIKGPDGREVKRVPFKDYVSNPPGCEYTVEHVTLKKKPEGLSQAQDSSAYRQGRLF